MLGHQHTFGKFSGPLTTRLQTAPSLRSPPLQLDHPFSLHLFEGSDNSVSPDLYICAHLLCQPQNIVLSLFINYSQCLWYLLCTGYCSKLFKIKTH